MTIAAPVPVRVLGGPTALINYAGLRLLTDPTFDEPQTYENGGLPLTKTAPPPVQPDQVVPVDAVLLSHDERPDNLDLSGRAFLRGTNRLNHPERFYPPRRPARRQGPRPRPMEHPRAHRG